MASEIGATRSLDLKGPPAIPNHCRDAVTVAILVGKPAASPTELGTYVLEKSFFRHDPTLAFEDDSFVPPSGIFHRLADLRRYNRSLKSRYARSEFESASDRYGHQVC